MAFICVVSVSPMRAMPSHRSEVVSQLLFGESLDILEEEKDGWIKVVCHYDGYEGWITKSHVHEAEMPANTTFSANWSNTAKQNGLPLQLPFGCVLPAENAFSTATFQFDFTDIERSAAQAFQPSTFLQLARLFLNTPYQWGGKSVFGIDCSGYVQQVLKCFGIKMLRDAYLQAEQGTAIGFLQEAKLGDLAFFDNAEGRITHVGFMLNDHEIIHSSGKVRIDRIDTQGIVNSDTGLRTHQLRIIKRIIG
jgi:cell wall-associated NlpC family hydrolase